MRRTTLKELGQSIERNKAELGYSEQDYVARNSGEFRTESKRALLRNIAAAAAVERGEEPPFKANY
ncbi:hypothetical protein [Thalassospira sp. CH_XMU1448-2]|uniref:hypothetical protein n=1 Tax=Thalassospira sp. CH_XMU1448-2 TaxID=3107773 RepID=UPI003009BF91